MALGSVPGPRGDRTLAVVYTTLAAALGASVVHFHYHAPMVYARWVAEDQPGEYATSIAFAGAGLLMIALALRPGPRARRISWWLIGIAALLVAGEEISWGERFLRGVLGVITPAAVRDINLQNEFNLHNLAMIDVHSRYYYLPALALLIWLLASVVTSILRPLWATRLLDLGVPLVPPRLVAPFLLAPAIILLKPITWWPEIAELAMGLAALAWAYDRFLHVAGGGERDRALHTIAMPAVAAGLIPLLALGLAWFSPADTFGQHVNRLASYYAERGLYPQAEAIYRQIYANPLYLTPETRLQHAAMLHSIGRDGEASQILAVAAEELQAAGRLENADSGRLRLLGVAYRSLGQDDAAQTAFARAITADDRQLQAASSPDDAALVRWSIAKTLASSGDRPAAVATAQRALTEVSSPAHRMHISRWLEQNQALDVSTPSR